MLGTILENNLNPTRRLTVVMWKENGAAKNNSVNTDILSKSL